MSKVTDYYGTKTKAIHRMKRYETRKKKLTRIHNSLDTYKGRGCAYSGWYYSTPSDLCLHFRHCYLKRLKRPANWTKRLAAKQVRRHQVFDEDASYCQNGASYKKECDLLYIF